MIQRELHHQLQRIGDAGGCKTREKAISFESRYSQIDDGSIVYFWTLKGGGSGLEFLLRRDTRIRIEQVTGKQPDQSKDLTRPLPMFDLIWEEDYSYKRVGEGDSCLTRGQFQNEIGWHIERKFLMFRGSAVLDVGQLDISQQYTSGSRKLRRRYRYYKRRTDFLYNFIMYN